MIPVSGSRQPRSDGVRNRERLLDAAERVIASKGVGAPLDEIARTAQLSNATLYRHFPSTGLLLRALHERLAAQVQGIAAQMQSEATAFHGLIRMVVGISEVLSSNPAAHAILQAVADANPGYSPGAAFADFITSSVRSAIADGDLHPQISGRDLLAVSYALGGLPSHLVDRSERLRITALVVASFRADLPGNPRFATTLRDMGLPNPWQASDSASG